MTYPLLNSLGHRTVFLDLPLIRAATVSSFSKSLRLSLPSSDLTACDQMPQSDRHRPSPSPPSGGGADDTAACGDPHDKISASAAAVARATPLRDLSASHFTPSLTLSHISRSDPAGRRRAAAGGGRRTGGRPTSGELAAEVSACTGSQMEGTSDWPPSGGVFAGGAREG